MDGSKPGQADRDTMSSWPSNGGPTVAPIGRSLFPRDAVAHIYRPARSAMTSGMARTRTWRLEFEPRSAPFIEPLMGWTSGDDTLRQVQLEFPTLNSAINYAERQGVAYVVHRMGWDGGDTAAAMPPARPKRADEEGVEHARSFSDSALDRLGLAELCNDYRTALDRAAERRDGRGADDWPTPMRVVDDPELSLTEKRSILMNWAHTQYLIDQASAPAASEGPTRSALAEVEEALLALERRRAGEATALSSP